MLSDLRIEAGADEGQKNVSWQNSSHKNFTWPIRLNNHHSLCSLKYVLFLQNLSSLSSSSSSVGTFCWFITLTNRNLIIVVGDDVLIFLLLFWAELFNNAISIGDYTTSTDWVIIHHKLEGINKIATAVWSRYYPNIYMEMLKQTTTDRDLDSNQTPPNKMSLLEPSLESKYRVWFIPICLQYTTNYTYNLVPYSLYNTIYSPSYIIYAVRN